MAWVGKGKFAPRLTDEQAAELVALSRAGWTQAQLAQRYGISHSAVNWRLSQKMARPADERHCSTCTCHMQGH